MRIDNEIKLDFKDVLIRPKRSTLKSRAEVSLDRTFEFRHSKLAFSGVPIIAANMDTVATFDMARALGKHKVMTAIHKHYSIEEWIEFAKNNVDLLPYVAASSGTSDNDFKKLSMIVEATNVPTICLDVANGYSEHFVNFLVKVREQYPKKTIMAGNVVTGEMVEELVLSGADIVKVGIGPGSVCTTRKKAGVGYPQLSAVIECADAAHGLGAHIISDGGCACPGDLAKAFGGGADFVMLGGMLSGHDECGGTIVEFQGKKMKEFYGMSSAVAMKKHSGSVANYRASEGKHVYVPYRGPVEGTILDILGGLRSACTYVGASQLKHLSKRTTFIRVTQQTNEIFAGLDNLPIPPQVTSTSTSKPISSSASSDEIKTTSSSSSSSVSASPQLANSSSSASSTSTSSDSVSAHLHGHTQSKNG
jgi:GMP reductase